MNKLAAVPFFIGLLATMPFFLFYDQYGTVEVLFHMALKAVIWKLMLSGWNDNTQSIESKAFGELLRLNNAFGSDQPLDEFRRQIDDFGAILPPRSDVVEEHFHIRTLDGYDMEAAWFIPPESSSSKQVVLYSHGGGYFSGSIRSHSGFCSHLAYKTQAKVLLYEYRRAPEYPLPTAVEDAITVYRWLTNDVQGVDASSVVVAGDSAGGGLSLLLMQHILHEAQQGNSAAAMPAAAVLISPWTDLSCQRESWTKNAVTDVMVSPQIGSVWVPRLLRANASEPSVQNEPLEAADPRVSPLFGPMRGLPPLYVVAGGAEVVLSDSVDFVDKAEEAGCDVTLQVVPKMQHIFPLFMGIFPEATKEVDEIACFIRAHLPACSACV
ncbi:Lipase/esterase protein (Bah) [Balamuthia mandrillaris]